MENIPESYRGTRNHNQGRPWRYLSVSVYIQWKMPSSNFPLTSGHYVPNDRRSDAASPALLWIHLIKLTQRNYKKAKKLKIWHLRLDVIDVSRLPRENETAQSTILIPLTNLVVKLTALLFDIQNIPSELSRNRQFPTDCQGQEWHGQAE